MKIPYMIKKKLKNGEIAYYFSVPARLYPEGISIKKSTPLGRDYLVACRKGFELYETLQSYRNYDENMNPKSLTFLWHKFKESRFYKKLTEDTANGYRYTYDFLCEIKSSSTGKYFKDLSLDSFTGESAFNLYERILEQTEKPYKARYCITLLKMLYNKGLYWEIFSKKNPFDNLRISKPKGKKETIRRNDLDEFIRLAKEKGKNHLALALELNDYLAQRGGDIRRLTDKNIIEHNGFLFFELTQHKTNKKVYIPIPETLWAEVSSKKGFIISDKFGGFSKDRLAKHFRNFSKEIEIKITFKQTRHTALTKYAEAGVPSNALRSLSGHAKEDTLNDYYVADTPELALSAYKKRKESEQG